MSTLYFAHPKATYGTPWATRAVEGVRAAFPGWQVVDPEHCGWRTDDDWRLDWRDILYRLDALVVAPDDQGCIGAGCVVEIADATSARVPVAAWHDERRVCDLHGLIMRHPPSPQRMAIVLVGERMTEGWPW